MKRPFRVWTLDAKYRPVNVVERVTTVAGAINYARGSFVRYERPDQFFLVTEPEATALDGVAPDERVVRAFAPSAWSDPSMAETALPMRPGGNPVVSAAEIIVNASRYVPFVGGV